MKLTAQQERAATADGSVAVIAGAGTGKTAMLANRFLHHVRSHGYSPIEIVAVTFTEKAAHELRARIRKELSAEISDPEVLAEVDAAQISTIHALAARICRDFYYLAGIPADFSILDETDSGILLADSLDDALGKVDPEIVAELGYSWLKAAVEQLLGDPRSAKRLLAIGADAWRSSVEAAQQKALSGLQSCTDWTRAEALLSECRGADGDVLENARSNAIAAMRNIREGVNVCDAIRVLQTMKARFGQAGNWNGRLDEMRSCLQSLKDAAAEKGPFWAASLQYSDADAVAAGRIGLLRTAFQTVNDHFSEVKIAEKCLDYNDLEIGALKILASDEAVQHYARRWKALLIDEVQDTNPAQSEIIEKLKSSVILTVVGDEKQSIYGFRNADVEVFRQLRAEIVADGGEEVQLSRSFRAHSQLTETMNRIFDPILAELHQELSAEREAPPHGGPHVTLSIVEPDGSSKPSQQIVEAKHIAERIKAMIDGGVEIYDRQIKAARRIEYRDIAILSRTWGVVETYIDALSAAGIPAVNAGGGSLLQTREAKDAIAMLSFLTDTSDDISLIAVLRGPFFAVSDRILFQLSRSKKNGTNWWQHIQGIGGEPVHARNVLADLLAERRRRTPEELLEIADEKTGYLAVTANLLQGARREADWRGFVDLVRRLARSGHGDLFGTVRQLRELADSKSEIPRPPIDTGNSVSLMTIHRAKGLEWPVVIVPDLASKPPPYTSKLIIDRDLGIAFKTEDELGDKAEPAIFRLIKKRKEARDLEEAKRLAYVALTRARDDVILTSTCNTGHLIDILAPGLEAAGVLTSLIPFDDSLPPFPPADQMHPFGPPAEVQTGPVRVGSNTISVTALFDYKNCPLGFRFRYIDGHPGIQAGSGHARQVGILTHLALEYDISETDKLRRFDPSASEDAVSEAIGLADVFRTNEAFQDFRVAGTSREAKVRLVEDKLTLFGVADLIGDDWVLDYKTGEELEPTDYALQLWAYARALNKPRAFVADLRRGSCYEFSDAELDSAGSEARRLAAGIFKGEYEPTSSPVACGRCHFSAICDSRYDADA